jgi:hypothetical protein
VARSPNLRGSLFSEAVPSEMNFGQVMLVRGLFAIALIATAAWHQGALRPLCTPMANRSRRW